MSLLIAPLDHQLTLLVRTSDGQLLDQAPDGHIRSQSTHDPLIAEGTGPRLSDTLIAEEVVAAWCLDSIVEDIEADWADPAIVC
jgi:hypothetical protein